MNTYVPSYYGDFKCKGGSCADNCCRGGWLIELDEETLEYIGSLGGEWGERLRSSLMKDEDDAVCFRLVDGHCPHLLGDGLCGVYRALGEEHMGLVCREFPRFTNWLGTFSEKEADIFAEKEFDTFSKKKPGIFSGKASGTFIEKGLGLACEEAARIILYDDRKFGLVLLGGCDLKPDVEFPVPLEIRQILAFRQRLIHVIEAGDGDIDTRISMCLCLAESYQEKINACGGVGKACLDDHAMKQDAVDFDVVDWDKYGMSGANGACLAMDIMDPDLGRTLFDIYDGLEVLNASWTAMRDDAFGYLFESDGKSGMDDIHDDLWDSLYRERMVASFASIERGERIAANIFKYLLYRYVCRVYEDEDVGAAVDENILDRVRFCVSFYIVLRQMLAGLYGKYGHHIKENQVIGLVKDFSRQVEYSEENVEAVMEEFLFGIEWG